MTPEQEERFVSAFEDIAASLMVIATIQQRRYDKEYPTPKKVQAEILRQSDEEREQFSDKGTQSWFTETEAATPEGKSRFQERFDKAAEDNAEPEGRSPKTTRSNVRGSGAVSKNK